MLPDSSFTVYGQPLSGSTSSSPDSTAASRDQGSEFPSDLPSILLSPISHQSESLLSPLTLFPFSSPPSSPRHSKTDSVLPPITLLSLDTQDLQVRSLIFSTFVQFISENNKGKLATQADLQHVIQTFQTPQGEPLSLADELRANQEWVDDAITDYKEGGKRTVHRREDTLNRSFDVVITTPPPKPPKGARIRPSVAHTPRIVIPIIRSLSVKETDKLLQRREIGGAIYFHHDGWGKGYIGQTKASVNKRTLAKVKDAAGTTPSHTVGALAREVLVGMDVVETEVFCTVPYGKDRDLYEQTAMFIRKLFGFHDDGNAPKTYRLPTKKWLTKRGWSILWQKFGTRVERSRSAATLRSWGPLKRKSPPQPSKQEQSSPTHKELPGSPNKENALSPIRSPSLPYLRGIMAPASDRGRGPKLGALNSSGRSQKPPKLRRLGVE